MTFSRLIRFTALLLIPALLSNSIAFAKKPVDPAAMKAKIQARGVGQGVFVTLADNTTAKGTIVTIGEQSFALKLKKVAQPREIEYAQLTGVHNDRLTRGQKVGIVVGVVAVAIIITAVTLKILIDNSFKNLRF